jgi:Secretion system C-terminal sorting domain
MRRLLITSVSVIFYFTVAAQTVPLSFVSGSLKDTASVFLNFTVRTDGSDAQLVWSTRPVQKEDYFVVERTVDGSHFEAVGAMGATEADTLYRLSDNSSGSHVAAYRLKYIARDGKTLYSKVIQIGATSNADFHFYPNPVDKLLIIRSNHAQTIQVLDGYGTVWYSGQVEAGMQVINVSTLQKGNYILKASDKETNTVTSEQLLKN